MMMSKECGAVIDHIDAFVAVVRCSADPIDCGYSVSDCCSQAYWHVDDGRHQEAKETNCDSEVVYLSVQAYPSPGNANFLGLW